MLKIHLLDVKVIDLEIDESKLDKESIIEDIECIECALLEEVKKLKIERYF